MHSGGFCRLFHHVLGNGHADSDVGGQQLPSPDSMSAMISHLTAALDKLGRVGYWVPHTLQGERPPQVMHTERARRTRGRIDRYHTAWRDRDVGAGNPMRITVVKNLRKGQANDFKEKGYRQKAATPWTEAEMQTIMKHMEEQLATCKSGMERLLVLRDALILALLWQTPSRGSNAGMWRLENIRLPTGMRCDCERVRAWSGMN